MTKRSGPPSGISVKEMDALRQNVLSIVNRNMPVISDVLAGHKSWTPQQAKLFLAMFDKVLPTLSSSHNITETLDMTKMSREELEKIAAGAAAADAELPAPDISTITYIPGPSAEPVAASLTPDQQANIDQRSAAMIELLNNRPKNHNL